MDSVFAGEGEVRRQLRDVDWSATAFGPVEDWSEVLTALVRFVLDSPNPLCLLWGPDHRQVYNDHYRPQLGHRHPAGLLQPSLECWPEVRPIFGPILDRVSSGEPILIEEYSLVSPDQPDASPSWFTTSWTPVYDAGLVAGVLVHAIDVTQRKRAEEEQRRAERAERRSLEKQVAERTAALAAREELLEAIMKAQAVSVAVLTAVRDDGGALVDLEFLISNATSNELGGTDLEGKRVAEVFPEARPSLLEHLRRVVETGEPLDEVFRIDVNGTEQWLRWEAVRFRDGLVLNSEFVTDQVVADRELRRLTADLEHARNMLRLELDAVLAAVPDGVALFDTEGRITYQNDASLRLFEETQVPRGAPAASWLPGSRLTDADGRPVPYQDSPLERALTQGQVTSGFLLRVTPESGRPRWLSLSCAPIRDERGRPAGAVVVQRDVTRQWVT